MNSMILPREETARASFVAALAHFCEEWQDNTDGSLLDVQASVGLPGGRAGPRL